MQTEHQTPSPSQSDDPRSEEYRAMIRRRMAEEATRPQPEPFVVKSRQTARDLKWAAKWATAMVGAIFLTWGCLSLMREDNTMAGRCERTAYEVYQIINPRLKLPRTARYSDQEGTLASDGRTCLVSGTVEAQNSFGGTVVNRYAYSAVLVREEGNVWQLTGEVYFRER